MTGAARHPPRTRPAPSNSSDGVPQAPGRQVGARSASSRRSSLAAVVWVTLLNTPGWAAVQQTFFNGEVVRRLAAPRLGGLPAQPPVLADGVGPGAAVRPADRDAPHAARPGVAAAARPRRRLHRPLPRRSRSSSCCTSSASASPVSDSSRSACRRVLGHRRPDPHLLGLRRRRSSAPASRRCIRRSARRRARSGSATRKTMRLIVVPQAVRKVTPALMNDFVALQKDVGLISVLGAVDAVRAAQIETAHVLQLHARTSSRACSSCCSRSRPSA